MRRRPLHPVAAADSESGEIMSVAIATQPAPSAGVASFLRRPGRLLIGGEWVESEVERAHSRDRPGDGRGDRDGR